jgi:hypothetical protein
MNMNRFAKIHFIPRISFTAGLGAIIVRRIDGIGGAVRVNFTRLISFAIHGNIISPDWSLVQLDGLRS